MSRQLGGTRLDLGGYDVVVVGNDEIGLCGAPIEDHHRGTDTAWAYLPDGEVVGIPYPTLLVRDADNALVVGRCFSATHDAHASVRSMGQCMAMGQAAGTAAALALAAGKSPRDLEPGVLRDRLRTDGAVLDVPPEPARAIRCRSRRPGSADHRGPDRPHGARRRARHRPRCLLQPRASRGRPLDARAAARPRRHR